LRVDKPWGHEEELQATERYSVWRLFIDVGQETSLHCHSAKDVFLVVERGPLLVEKLTEQDVLHKGETLLIERGEYHRLKAPRGCDGAVVLELEWPNNRDDIIRKDDKYGRCA
jgi:mannose-6-phosphate isomerase-like protein (cupin superfamily)